MSAREPNSLTPGIRTGSVAAKKWRNNQMPRSLCRCLLTVLVVGLSFYSPASAAPKEKPAATVTDRSISASLTIDPRLTAFPGLEAKLLATGKREMAEWQTDAGKARKETPQIFRNGRRYSFERNYEERSTIDSYVSIVRTDFADSLGAHPNTIIDTLLWDTTARKFVSIRPFFKETAVNGPTMKALASAVRAAVQAEKKARHIDPAIMNDPMWLADIKPDLTKIGGAALAPSTESNKSAGLLVYFSPYAVGPYVEGPYTVFVRWTVFKTYLSRTGAELFGGDRPPGEAKNDRP